MMTKALTFRKIALEDIDELAAIVADAFVDYSAFAPAGWLPPSASEQVDVLQRWIADADFWGELASDGGAIAGHTAFVPAARHTSQAVPDSTLAHLGHLFVRPQYWGSGTAAQLLKRAMDAAALEGFVSMRLFVPAGQLRARAFYGREGFLATGEPFDIGLGLPVFEYRCSLER